LVLLPLFGFTQADQVPRYVYHGPEKAYANAWGNFWYKIERTTHTYNGYYWYYILAYSASQNKDCETCPVYKATTYVELPVITMYYGPNRSYYYQFPMKAALFDWEWTVICYFYTTDPNAYFTKDWKAVYPYQRSYYVK
jgi:hypothetical protein